LTLVSRDLRKLTSAVAAVAIVAFGLVVVDQGHGRAMGAPGTAAADAATATTTSPVTLPEVVVVAKRVETW
jgi:hypothetical protein